VRRGEGYIKEEQEIIINREEHHRGGSKEKYTIRVYEIEFVRADVLRVWPPPKPKAEPVAPSMAPAQTKTTEARTEPEPTPSAAPRPRGAYRNDLRTYLATRELTALLRQGKDAITAEFIDYCRREKPELLAKLPKSREIAKQVQKILDDRRVKRQTGSATNHPLPPTPSRNRS
jgi:hypothetical protein